MEKAKERLLLEPGVVLNGKWEILEHIAAGGKGDVYRAKQTSLDRDVVVKTIRAEYLAEIGDDPEDVETELGRFRREAMALARISNPYIVQVFDQESAVVNTEQGERTIQYLVMEYVPGSTLRETLPEQGVCRDERGSREWIRRYFLPLLEGVEAFHSLGIVHRDIKPENVLLKGDVPKITDFGIAGGAKWTELTKSHHVEGTITYMAPEQFMDLGETDVRGDVYALGKILYEAVAGRMDKKTARPLKSVCLDCADTPFLKKLDQIIRDATAEDKADRIPTVTELRERLQGLLDEFDDSSIRILGLTLHSPGRRGKILLLVAAGVVIALIVISNLIHHVFMVRQAANSEPVFQVASPANGPTGGSSSGLSGSGGGSVVREPSVPGKDGSVLMRVPGGQFRLTGLGEGGAAVTVRVAPFYMGETEITNEQYVKFLNQVSDRITHAGGVVSVESRPWLFLGEVFGGYEPIVFKDGFFAVKDRRYASHPVVRVTGYGALAYVRHFGFQLPSEFQWYAAAVRPSGTGPQKAGGGQADANAQTHADLEREVIGLVDAYGVLDKFEAYSAGRLTGASQIPHEVWKYPPNMYGIRGLRSNIAEWGSRSRDVDGEPGRSEGLVVLGGLEGTWLLGASLVRGPVRDPGDAFACVGFRIVRKIDDSSAESEGNDVKK